MWSWISLVILTIANCNGDNNNNKNSNSTRLLNVLQRQYEYQNLTKLNSLEFPFDLSNFFAKLNSKHRFN